MVRRSLTDSMENLWEKLEPNGLLRTGRKNRRSSPMSSEVAATMAAGLEGVGAVIKPARVAEADNNAVEDSLAVKESSPLEEGRSRKHLYV